MRVLIVDDEPEALELFQKKLAQLPEITEVFAFSGPEEALQFLRETMVDVAFLDIEMYGMSGIEMARYICELHPLLNVIFVTGYAHFALDAFEVMACDYLLKPVQVEAIRQALTKLRYPVTSALRQVRIKAFGTFEIFVGDRPLLFRRTKAKEILAYLIDRHGAGVSKKELAGILWPEQEYTRMKQIELQTLISAMLHALTDANAESIVIRGRNSLAIDPGLLDCDYYAFLRGEAEAISAYCGEYMSNYEWSDMTAAMLSLRKNS